MLAERHAIIDRLQRFMSDRRSTEIVAAYVFGSQAEAREHLESDVDVGVLLDFAQLPSRRDRFDRALSLASELQEAAGDRQIDLLVLNDAPPGLAARVAVEGVRIFASNPELEHAFRRDAQLRAADLAPFIARAARLKLKSMER